ncbi:MAG: hypothetical protein MR440_00175 [Firmicutes bacterium]|nr:hypothetical protein [Bacillota bacterium]
MKIIDEISGKITPKGEFVTLNGSKWAKKCKNRVNPENPRHLAANIKR